MPPSKSQTHITPDRIFEIIQNEWDYFKDELYDPCPAFTAYRAPIFFNGLYGNWKDINYINPPYEKKKLELFVKKAVEQSKQKRRSVMLLPSKTDQEWFHDIILKNNYQIVWIRKRLQFKNNKNHSTDTHFLVLVK